MFNFFKKEPKDSNIRDLLFGDVPISGWPAQANENQLEPWNLFKQAREEMERNNPEQAIEILQRIVKMEKLESRHYLQAWYFLKKFNVLPEGAFSKKVYGVVVEVGLDDGLDILAAYEDCSARYFNYSGAAVIWDRPNNSLDKVINDLISISQEVVQRIGVWENERPPQPPKGSVRLNFLTPSGLHFGQGTMEAISNDPMGGLVLNVATYLMQQLIQKSSK